MSTKDRLAKALAEADAPGWLILDAKSGRFDDFESEESTPIVNLVTHCRRLGLNDIADRAIAGEFDGTLEESQAWAESEDGKRTFAQLREGK